MGRTTAKERRANFEADEALRRGDDYPRYVSYPSSTNNLIDDWDPVHLKSALQALCQDDRDVRKKVIEFLEHHPAPESASETEDHPGVTANRGSERKGRDDVDDESQGQDKKSKATPTKAICSQCGEWATTDGREGACLYHDGRLEPNDDLWMEWDGDCDGEPDDDETMVQRPEACTWTCCQEYGEAAGCVDDAHATGERTHFAALRSHGLISEGLSDGELEARGLTEEGLNLSQ